MNWIKGILILTLLFFIIISTDAVDINADFSANVTIANVSDAVAFTDLSVNTSTYQWDFGDSTPPSDYLIKWDLDSINSSGYIRSSGTTKYDMVLYPNASFRPSLSEGVKNWSLKFKGLNEGINDFITPPAAGNDLDIGTNDRSITMWVKMNGTTRFAAETLIGTGAGGGSTAGLWAWIQSTTVIFVDFCDGTAPRLNAALSTNKNIYDNKWHQIAIVINRSGNLTLFTDGVPSLTGAKVGIDITPQKGSVNDPYTPHFGRYTNGSGTFQFDGSMDEIRMYNRVLTQSEITALYQSGMKNPVHNYTSAGVYSVAQIAWNVFNVSDTETKINYITVLGPSKKTKKWKYTEEPLTDSEDLPLPWFVPCAALLVTAGLITKLK
jgi:hypothetical protein